MKFNLCNPSDSYHFEADDLELAAVMVCLLGDGKYPATALGADKSEANNVPPFFFGGHDEWFTSKFGASFEATARRCVDERTEALANAFASVTLTVPPRTSLNDIGGRAHAYAAGLRSKAKAA